MTINVSPDNGNEDATIRNLIVGFGDTVSNPTNVEDYDFKTISFCSIPCELPQNFVIQTSLDEPGIYYMRAFGEYKNKVYISESEERLVVATRTNTSLS